MVYAARKRRACGLVAGSGPAIGEQNIPSRRAVTRLVAVQMPARPLDEILEIAAIDVVARHQDLQDGVVEKLGHRRLGAAVPTKCRSTGFGSCAHGGYSSAAPVPRAIESLYRVAREKLRRGLKTGA